MWDTTVWISATMHWQQLPNSSKNGVPKHQTIAHQMLPSEIQDGQVPNLFALRTSQDNMWQCVHFLLSGSMRADARQPIFDSNRNYACPLTAPVVRVAVGDVSFASSRQQRRGICFHCRVNCDNREGQIITRDTSNNEVHAQFICNADVLRSRFEMSILCGGRRIIMKRISFFQL